MFIEPPLPKLLLTAYYVQLAGKPAKAHLQEYVGTPDWNALTYDERRDYLADTLKETRADAREHLLVMFSELAAPAKLPPIPNSYQLPPIPPGYQLARLSRPDWRAVAVGICSTNEQAGRYRNSPENNVGLGCRRVLSACADRGGGCVCSGGTLWHSKRGIRLGRWPFNLAGGHRLRVATTGHWLHVQSARLSQHQKVRRAA